MNESESEQKTANGLDQEQVIAFFEQTCQDLRDIKARPWNFLTILVAITGGILSLDNAPAEKLRWLLMIGELIAVVSTILISWLSFDQLQGRRKRLRNIYKKLPEMASVRCGNESCNHKSCVDNVLRYDWGDRFFVIIGTISPILLGLIVFCLFFGTRECQLLMCV